MHNLILALFNQSVSKHGWLSRNHITHKNIFQPKNWGKLIAANPSFPLGKFVPFKQKILNNVFPI